MTTRHKNNPPQVTPIGTRLLAADLTHIYTGKRWTEDDKDAMLAEAKRLATKTGYRIVVLKVVAVVNVKAQHAAPQAKPEGA